MKSKLAFVGVAALSLTFIAADTDSCDGKQTSDDVQRQQQERILQEGTSQVGMPAIKNFRERKLLKDILELRDQSNFTTYTYLWSDMQGKWIFFCNSIGYGIPYATEFTNPQKVEWKGAQVYGTLPQADPNGLFSPAAAEGTWVMCKEPNGTEVKPVYLEPRCIVSPFELPSQTSAALPTKQGK